MGELAMEKLLTSAMLLVGMTTATLADPDYYVCAVEASAGLRYDKQSDIWPLKPFQRAGSMCFVA